MGDGEQWRKFRVLEEVAARELPLDSFSPEDLGNVAQGAIYFWNTLKEGECTPMEKELLDKNIAAIKRVISLCFIGGKEEHGAEMAEAVITCPGIRDRQNDLRVKETVSFLSAFAATENAPGASGSQAARKKIFELVGHSEPSVAAVVLDNLTHAADFELLEKVCGLLVSEHPEVRKAALRFIEIRTGEVAFRGTEGDMLAEKMTEFMKTELKVLEKVYPQLEAMGDKSLNRRVLFMITLTYNHILRNMYKEAEMSEGREWRPYGAVLEHLASLTPVCFGILVKRLNRDCIKEDYMDPQMDERIKNCVIDTLERMGTEERYRERIVCALKDFYAKEGVADSLRKQAMEAAGNLEGGRLRHSIPALADSTRKVSVAPAPVPGSYKNNK